MNDNNAIAASLALIERRIGQKLSTDILATSVFISKYHYQRLFHEAVGDSVMEYVKKRRLTLAAEELTDPRSNATVLDIALKYGYDSHEGFSRAFKAYTGVSPTEYRRFGLGTPFRNLFEKGIVTMKSQVKYKQSTDAIIKDINELTAELFHEAEFIRKHAYPPLDGFVNMIAQRAEALAEQMRDGCSAVSGLTDSFGEITKRFGIIKMIDNAAFWHNILGFTACLWIRRMQTELAEKYVPIAEKILETAQHMVLKAGKVAGILNDLAALIFEDMLRTVDQGVNNIADAIDQLAADAVSTSQGIKGYTYIAEEVAAVSCDIKAAAQRLRMSCTEASASSKLEAEKAAYQSIDEMLFRLEIIGFTADADLFRAPQHEETRAMCDGVANLIVSIKDKSAVIGGIISETEANIRIFEQKPTDIRTGYDKHLSDIAYQGSILNFFLKGELSYEKLGKMLAEDEKQYADQIQVKMNSFIAAANGYISEHLAGAELKAAVTSLSEQVSEVERLINAEETRLSPMAAPLKVIALECEGLSKRIRQLADMVEAE